MAEFIEDVTHLSEEIGFRPAGTEEEQQAALYIADELQKRSGFATVIEDFRCVTNPHIVRAILYGIAFVAVLLSIFVPAIALPCFIVLLAATVLYVLEIMNKPILSRFLKQGVSQNVVAKYQPAVAAGIQRRRKVVLIANYDSGKVLKEETGALAPYMEKIQKATAIALGVACVLLLIKTVALAGDASVVSLIFNVLLFVCAILFALPVVRALLFQRAEYSASANNNASGVAVLMDVAKNVASGLVSSEEAQAMAADSPATVHGEAAAREAGAVPDGAAITYEDAQMSPQESLAAAKAAIAALTGKPIADKVPITDVSAHLVKGGGLYPEDESASTIKFEVGEQPEAKPARKRAVTLDTYPTDTASEADAAVSRENTTTEAAQPVEAPKAEAKTPVEKIAAAEAAQAAAEAAAANAAEAEPEQPVERAVPEALQAGHTGMMSSVDKTPSWARAAQAKARANKGEEVPGSVNVSRSRYADTPAAQLTDEAIHGGNAYRAVAAPSATNEVSAEGGTDSDASAAEVIEDQSPLAQRLAALRKEISAAEAPHISEETQSALDAMEPVSAAPAATVVVETAPVAAVPEDVVLEENSVTSANASAVEHLAEQASSATAAASERLTSAVGFFKSAVKQHTGAKQEADSVEDNVTETEQPSAVEPEPMVEPTADEVVSPSKTAAISPIDVSAFLNKEEGIEETAAEEAPSAKVAEIEQSAAGGEPEVAAEATTVLDPAQVVENVGTAATNRVSASEIQEAIQETLEAEPEIEPAEAAEPVAPIVGMDAMASSLPDITEQDSSRDDAQVIVLPDVDSDGDFTADAGKQRAPMADINDGTQSAAKSALLSNMIPRITGSFSAVNTSASGSDTFGLELPALGNTDPDQQAVSLTGSFSTVGGTGAFAPVGDELVADVDPEDLYVDDADDSAYEQEHTETGAFAGPGYVEMPKSRVGRLFGRFGKKNKKQPEQSVNEWVDVDEGYTAREVGKARGDWSSFRSAEPEETFDQEFGEPDNSGFVEVDYSNSDFNKRGWNGGAFSLDRLRNLRKAPIASEEYIEEDSFGDAQAAEDAEVLYEERGEDYAAVSQSAVQDEADEAVAEVNREMQRLQQFRHPDINTEVWFVGLGADMYSHEGMKAFLEDHAEELKGAVIVNLEALGSGNMCFIESEGQYMPMVPSSRLKRVIRQAAERSGVPCSTAKLDSRTTPATIAMAKGFQAFTIAGTDGINTAHYSAADDTVDNVEESKLAKASNFVMAILKNI